MKIVRESLNKLPTWESILTSAPTEILDLIEKSKTTPQSIKWHPENEVYKHIRIVFDRARDYGDLNLLIASLFHDLGKMSTTHKNKKGGYSAYGHENASKHIARKNSDWIAKMGGDSKEVIEIVANHMRIKQMDRMRPAKREAMRNHPYYDKLMKFTAFDNMTTLTPDEINRYK